MKNLSKIVHNNKVQRTTNLKKNNDLNKEF